MKFDKELLLDASRDSWKMSSTHGTEYDKSYKRLNKKNWDAVWKRDDNACYYCGFKSLKHQEIHHLNHDHEDNEMDNLVTVCPLCHQSFHLDVVSNTNGGKIIWAPEITQQELNYLCRAIFIALEEFEQADVEKRQMPDFVKVAKMMESSLLERALPIEQHIQSGISEPISFANALINMDEAQREKTKDLIHGFKLLHFKQRFALQTKFWKNNTFKSLPVDSWLNLVHKKSD